MRILFVQSVGGGKKPWWFQHISSLIDSHEVEFTREPRQDLDGWRFIWKLLRLYGRLGQYDAVVTLQDGHATFLFSFLNRFRFKKPFKHVVLELITRERENMPVLRSWLKYGFLRFALRSVDLIGCSSRKEIDYYVSALKIDKRKFFFVPLACDPELLVTGTQEGNYIVSAGRTGRDYATLLDAVRDLPIEVRVIAGKGALDGLNVPPNVKTYFDIPPNEFIKMLALSNFVVIPLEDRQISVGQSVILQAMALGKGLVTTDIGASHDYVDDGVDGVLVAPENVAALREAIDDMLKNDERKNELGSAARKSIENGFVPRLTWPKIVNAIESVVGV